MLSATLNPGVAYRLNDWLSIGAGFSVTYALLSETAAVNNIQEQLPDGRLKFKADDWGFGGNVGVLLEPSRRMRFGLTYHSPVDLSYEDRIRFVNLGPGLRRALAQVGVVGGTTTLAQTNPQTVMASWYYALTKRSALMGNFGWQNWQRFGEVDVTISSETNRQVTSDAGFHDTWHGALGAQHRFFRSWLLSAGLAYDSSPVSKFHRTPVMPFDEAWRFGVGLQYDWSEALTVGVAYEFVNGGEAEIANLRRGPLTGTLQGKYPANDIHFLAMNMAMKS